MDLKNKKIYNKLSTQKLWKNCKIFSHDVNSHACLAFFDQIMYFN